MNSVTARQRTLGAAVALVLAAAGGGFAVEESRGWPFLARPVERWLGAALDRRVSFGADGDGRFRLHLLGGLRLELARIEIANASWSTLGPMLDATNATIVVRYRDLVGIRRGEPLRVESLTADALAIAVERRADGRANWQFGDASPADTAPRVTGVSFGHLALRHGTARIVDVPRAVDIDARFDAPDDTPDAVVAQLKGTFHQRPLSASLHARSILPLLADIAHAPPVAIELRAHVGQTRLDFDGEVKDLLSGVGLKGRYDLSGPSLAAVGEPIGVTLPTTSAFKMRGTVAHDGHSWSSVVEQARVGRSEFAGDFVFTRPPAGVPTLTGHLRGPVLWLADLGPAVGLEPQAPTRAPGRVLPDRPFDLPSLSAMNADVVVALDRFESGSAYLQAVEPLHAHVRLQDGVLTIDDIDASLAQGRLRGRIVLDGRARSALWQVSLRASDILIEQWIHQQRKHGGPPFATGRLVGQIELRGHGRSVADLLASADGTASALWLRGTVSHLAIEAAGLDLAQAFGVMLKGDDALRVDCGAADLTIHDGQVTPRVMVVDTRDSTIDVDGSMSLADERLDLVAKVSPKDVSPLALRAPLRVEGTFGAPQFRVEKAPLLRRVVPAALLAMVNPLAGLLPLIDTGGDGDRDAIAACSRVTAKGRPAPTTTKPKG